MVIVSGEELNASEPMNEYASGSTEREALEAMSQSAVRYRYDSPDELKFELKFRGAVADRAVRLNRSALGFSVFHKSKCNEEYWNRMHNGGFELKEGSNPAEAISDIYSHGGRYATECATAMVIVFYGAALDVFGEDAFNRLFSRITLMNWHSINPLLQGIAIPRRGDILPGDRAYFENPDVDPKTPQWQGENVIVLPDKLYYGHGIGVTTADKIIETLNANRRKGATESAYFLDVAARPDYERLYRASERPAAQSARLVWAPFPPPVARG